MFPPSRDLFSLDLPRKEESQEDFLQPVMEEIMNPLCAITLSLSHLRVKAAGQLWAVNWKRSSSE